MRIIKTGVCGIPYSLDRIARELDAIEIQKTFYKLPRLETAAKWHERVGGQAELTLKAPQLITHPPTSPTYRKANLHIPADLADRYGYFKPTREVMKARDDFLQFARTAGAKMLIFQTPASFREKDEHIQNLEKFFSEFPKDDFVICWEPRGEWNRETLKYLFNRLGIIHVVDPFRDSSLTTGIYYYRLHGLSRGYRYTYTREELEQLYKNLPSDGKVYVMFNNTDMYRNALEFKEILSKS